MSSDRTERKERPRAGRKARRAGYEEGGAEDMTQLLSGLMPRPESSEKVEMRSRAGEMASTVEAVRARSSAKANASRWAGERLQ